MRFYLLLLLGASCFGVGYYASSVVHDLEVAEHANEQLNNTLAIERLAALNISKIEDKALDDKESINNNFNSALNELDKLQLNSSKQRMPEGSNPTIRSKAKCECKPCRSNKIDYKGLLEVGRQCDLIAEKYNRLLSIYNTIKN